jgi:LmbE family N-acetylglucosaminyl deacetylase
MQNMKKDTVVVFAPHPDDETLGCGGTIAKETSEGSEVSVVVMTDGRYALKSLGIETDPTPEELKEIRKKELRSALKILGVQEENTVFFDFEDSSLVNNEKSLEKKVQEVLDRNYPSEVYVTSAKDLHLDHRVANRIVRNGLSKLGLNVNVYQYIIAPRARREKVLDLFLNLWKQDMVYVDISDFLQLKKAALKKYKSQIATISSKQVKPVLSSSWVASHLKDREVFFRI